MGTVSKIDSLRGVPLFSSLTESDLAIMAAISDQKSYKKNQTIFREGDPGGILFVLVSGAVKITVINSSGEEITLNMLYSNDNFGDLSLLHGKSRSETATTVEDTEVLVIYRDDFLRLIRKKPEFVIDMLATLALRLRNLTDKMK